MKNSIKGPVYLFLCAFFWGLCFSCQSNAMNYIGPYTFVFLRSSITCLILCAVLPLLNRISGNVHESAPLRKHLPVGIGCGCFLVLASILQQIGLVTTTAAKSGFITALYIIIVPILGIFLGKRPSPTVWLSICASLVGLYFLCIQDTVQFESGDLITLGSALVFAIHILFIDRYGTSLNSVLLSCIQFGSAGIISGILAFTFETPAMSGILACWKDILYAAVFSGAIGYTLQIGGQKYSGRPLASLLMCLESVFAAIGGWFILGETLSAKEIFGCALMLCGSMVAQIPVRRKDAD